MNLMLYKDGRLVMNEQGKPLEGQESDLRNLYAYVTDPADGDTLVYDSTAGMWKAGQGVGSFTPDISDPQDGDTLVYNAAQQKWVNGANRAMVEPTFTVTEDEQEESGYSVTCDMTVAEIKEAVEAGTCRTAKYKFGAEVSFDYLNLSFVGEDADEIAFNKTYVGVNDGDRVINIDIVIHTSTLTIEYFEVLYPPKTNG